MQTMLVVHPVHEIPQFDLVKHTHVEKTYEGGEDIWYMQWTLDGLCIWTLHMNFVYTLDEGFFF